MEDQNQDQVAQEHTDQAAVTANAAFEAQTEASERQLEANTGDIIESIEMTLDKDEQEQEKLHEHQQQQQQQQQKDDATETCQKTGDETGQADKSVSVGASALAVTETQEAVSSSSNREGEVPQAKSNSRRLSKSRSTSRRVSYQASRPYASSFQNYGLSYLPYKSNFEPSEDARRRADEFVKTLKL